jgi:SAM-dependent methyltransferase
MSYKNVAYINTKNRAIKVVHDDIEDPNIDNETVASFGEEWKTFNSFSDSDIDLLGKEYFDLIDSTIVNSNSIIADFGCGSGRFSKYFQGKVKKIVAIDPSDAIFEADKLLGKDDSVELVKSSISNIPYDDNSFDFVMSIGVLHHIPDTRLAMKNCIAKVKHGGFFFVYLYYSFDNRGFLFKLIWKVSDLIRKLVSALPIAIRKIVCNLLAVFIYFPVIYFIRSLKLLNVPESFWGKMPLSIYHDKSNLIIFNDAYDRFGTPLEQRFSRSDVNTMMIDCGLTNIRFSEKPNYWRAIGQKI